MEGMLEHGLANDRSQSVAYAFTHASGTGLNGYSATSFFDPQGYMELEGMFTNTNKEYNIVGHKVEEFPAKFKRTNIKDRLKCGSQADQDHCRTSGAGCEFADYSIRLITEWPSTSRSQN